MATARDKVKIRSGELRSFIDQKGFRKYNQYELSEKSQHELVDRVMYQAVLDMKMTELYAIGNRQVFSNRFLTEKLQERVEKFLGSAIESYEEKTQEEFDLEGVLTGVVERYDIDAANTRTLSYLSRKNPVLVPASYLKRPFSREGSWFNLSAGPEFVVLKPLKRNKISVVPFKVTAKVTEGTKMQMAATCLAMSNYQDVGDRFLDLGYGRRIMTPNSGVLALHDGSEVQVALDDEWYKLHSYIGELLESKERAT